MDLVHNDDVIITSNLCIGSGCASDGSEVFGYDSIRLKKNTFRIHYDDTGTAANYPNNDWRIVLNDSVAGGLNYFGIEDSTASRRLFTIEAGAPANSFYIDDYGRVGLGTSVPVVELHLVDGDTPIVRLDQDTSGGYAARAWDLAGNETNFFIRDVTAGTLPFRIQPGTPTNAFCLKANGNVDLGTWSPDYPMELETTGANATFVCDRTDGAMNFISSTFSYGQFGAVSNHAVRILANSSWKMRINTNGTLDMSDGGGYDGTWNPASSKEYKENIHDLTTEEAIDALAGLNPVKFNYKAHPGEQRVGFIAEEVPELVALESRKRLSPLDIVSILAKVARKQQQVLNRQQERLQERQKAISELKRKIAVLKKK